MTISSDVKQRVKTEYTDKTIAQLAKENSVSTSSIQRIIREAKTEQSTMKEAHAAATGGGEGAVAAAAAGADDAMDNPFMFVPDTPLDQKEQIQLDSDGHMSFVVQNTRTRSIHRGHWCRANARGGGCCSF